MKCTRNDFHCLTAVEVMAELRTSADGLSSEEATARLAEYGPNVLPDEDRPSRLWGFLKQFGGGLNLVLFVAAGLSLAVGHGFDAASIMLVLTIKAVVGFIQERKAERALESLKRLSAPYSTVRRDGVSRRVAAAELVPGDVVILTEGDRVGADLRLLACRDLRVNESALTGESVPAEKGVDPVAPEAARGDRSCMAFMGTMAVGGEGFGIVTATGQRTAFGSIARSLVAIRHEPTPIERGLQHLSSRLAIGAVALAALIAVVGVLRGLPALDMFLYGVATAVAVIPEGLPVVLVIVLAIGVTRMAKRNAVTRHLPAVETLGGVDVICTDKTGTLTENKMTVRAVMTLDHRLEVTGSGWEPKGEFLADGAPINVAERPVISRLLRASALVTKAEVRLQDGHWEAVGDPTEAALAVLAQKAGYNRAELLRSEQTLDEVPFSSERKLRAVLHEYVSPNGAVRREVMVVGAFEAISSRSTMALSEAVPQTLTPEVMASFEAANAALASQSLRVIAVAVKEVGPDQAELALGDLAGLSLVGLVGMIDPPRPGVAEALKRCRAAGIRVIMTTGDHKTTAEAIAREIGLANGDLAPADILTDAEIVELTDEQFRGRLATAVVLARVSPETKLRAVALLQGQGHVVAMTGDGVNDAPALKKADIGIAMGRTGTDVTREVAEMVLTDDNFVSIVSAVEEGRIVYRNVKQTAAYLMMTNVGEAATLALAMFVGLPLPLLAVQLLWLNVVTDGFTDAALATERRHGDELERPPRSRTSALLSRRVLGLIVLSSSLMALGTLALFIWASGRGGLDYARSVAFLSMTLFQFWNAFGMRSPDRSVFSLGWLSNRWLFAGIGGSLALVALIMYVPAFQPLFRLTPLGFWEWALCLVAASSVLWAVELLKRFRRR